MPILQRLLRALGYQKPATLVFEMDQQLAHSLQELAAREQRPEDEIAADLLSFALLQREMASETQAAWRALSPRECEIAALTCLNYTNRQIASSLYISPETVKTHIRNVLRKFNVHSKAELRRLLADWDFAAWYDARE